MKNQTLQTAKTLSFVGSLFLLILGIIESITIIGMLIGVPSIIGGAIVMRYHNYSDEEFLAHLSGLLGWGIFGIFSTVVGGVLLLIAYVTSSDINIDEPQESGVDSDFMSVEKAFELKEKGAISEAEYEQIKQRALKVDSPQANTQSTATSNTDSMSSSNTEQ